MDEDLLRLIAAERRAEAVRDAAHQREAARQRGVAWSGLGPDPRRRRDEEALTAEAARRLAALGRWRESPAGRLLDTLVEAQRAAQAAWAAAEAARSALARDPLARPDLTEMRRQAWALGRVARRAARGGGA